MRDLVVMSFYLVGGSMGDIIDLRGRRNKGIEVIEPLDDVKAPILDISGIREQMIKEERRQAKRTILNGFIGAHLVVPGRGLLKIALFDISNSGVSFDVAPEWGHFKEKEEVAMRFYFNQKTYFPFVVRITGGRILTEEGVFRHGASFIPDTINGNALNHFIDFLESVSAALKTDKGDLFISGMGV
jgi:hypothetical protein